MDYYTITYFHIFYIPDKYEAFALILACEIYHLVCKRALETFRPFNMSHASKKKLLEPDSDGHRAQFETANASSKLTEIYSTLIRIFLLD